MIDVFKLTIQDLENGKCENDLPELYSSRDCVENNTWHNHESVFDHTLKVFGNMAKIMKNINNVRTEKWLDEKIGKRSRKELLLISSLLHDMSKGESLVNNNDGITSCPKHEERAGEKTKQFSVVFGMDDKEIELVKKIVSHHGEMHKALEPELNGNDGKIEALKKSGVYFELLFLCCADTLDSYLAVANPYEYKKRIEFYGNEINNM